MIKKLNLSRTKIAIENYDKLNFILKESTGSNVDELIDSVESAEKAVGEAFALDTADRNNYNTAKLQLPDSWLRNLVRKYGNNDS